MKTTIGVVAILIMAAPFVIGFIHMVRTDWPFVRDFFGSILLLAAITIGLMAVIGWAFSG